MQARIIKQKILIVDDQQGNLDALTAVLEGIGAEVLAAKSGSEALRLTMRHTFALAILDVRMPDMDGYELATFLRSVQVTRNLPIIFLTANASDDAQVFMGYESGAVDYIVKPYSELLLLSKVRVFLSLHAITAELEDKVSELTEAKQAAEAANVAKSAFLATMGHEIRTPLNALVGISYLLRHSSLNAQQLSDIKAIEAASKHLLTIINDILDFSKIEAGRLTLELHVFSLPDLLQDLQAIFHLEAQSKHLDFTIEAEEGLPEYWVGDAGRLRQCLCNYLGNALKFTEQGGIGFFVTSVDKNTQKQTLRFVVRDSGIGLNPEQQANLFQPFVQADASMTRRFGGTGLGLSIVKRLVELMGGQVGITSQVGQGSEFWLEIPLQISAEQGQLADLDLSFVKRPLWFCLIIDDAAQREILKTLGQSYGWKIELGFPSNDSAPDLILLEDAESGTSLEQQERIIVLENIRGMDASDFFNRVNEALVERGHGYDYLLRRSVMPRGQSHWLSGLHLLIVDDARLNLEVLGRVLEQEGATTTRCESGEAALHTLAAQPTAFAAILMDLQMPGLDGCETTLQIRQRLKLSLPIIALTAGATTTEQDRALTAGMDDFLTKPIDPERLVRVLRQHIERSQQQSLRLTPRETPAQAPAPAADLGGILDLADLRQRFDGDLSLLPDLLGMLLAETEGAADTARALLDAGDYPALARFAHSQKGQFANIGAESVRAAALALEQAAEAGSPAEAEPAVKAFAAAHQTFCTVAIQWLAEQPG